MNNENMYVYYPYKNLHLFYDTVILIVKDYRKFANIIIYNGFNK